MRKVPITLDLITSTHCNLKCPTCPEGRKEFDQIGVMSLDMFRRIYDKCCAEAYVSGSQVYHYNEPLLVKHMPEMVRISSKEYKVPVLLSSHLSVPSRLVQPVMEAEPESILLSTSGFTQAVYEIDHPNGNIELVKENMKLVAQHRTKNTHVQLSWHRYNYNDHEMDLMRAYAEDLGFRFVPYIATLMPPSTGPNQWRTGVVNPNGARLIVPVAEAEKLCFERRHWRCQVQNQSLTVDAEGYYYNCGYENNSGANRIGSLFDTTVPELFADKQVHPMCIACKAVGGHIWAAQNYTVPEYSPVRLADEAYRRLGLSGRFPKLATWATRKLYFWLRPQTRYNRKQPK